MVIFGSALISVCFVIGNLIGELLGVLIGVNTNVGGVGFAMLLLILSCSWLSNKGYLGAETAAGIKFWQSMYIPVVVAMTATQDVMGALSSGLTAIVGGLLVVGTSFLILMLMTGAFSKKKKGGAE